MTNASDSQLRASVNLGYGGSPAPAPSPAYNATTDTDVLYLWVLLSIFSSEPNTALIHERRDLYIDRETHMCVCYDLAAGMYAL